MILHDLNDICLGPLLSNLNFLYDTKQRIACILSIEIFAHENLEYMIYQTTKSIQGRGISLMNTFLGSREASVHFS